MAREKARSSAAVAGASARRPAAVQKHKRKRLDAGAPLVAKPVLQKMKYGSYWEFQENTEKKKKLEFSITNDKTPPAGFTFVAVGNPELSRACKELSREEDAMIFIVSTTKEEKRNLFDHVHRIGFHFRSYIVDQAASSLGGMQAVTGEGQPITINGGDAIPETQEEIDRQADAALRDLFPRIPNTDREMIIQHAFQKGAIFHGKPVVGLQAELSLSRRVQLAANAHIRHTHTRYDELLRETDYLTARRVVEPLCLDYIMKWRGDEETGRDQLDEILREVVVIPDSESEEESEEEEESASDDDEVEFLRAVVRPSLPREVNPPSRPPSKFHVDDPRYTQPPARDRGGTYSEIATRTRSKANQKQRKPRKERLARRGFKRYQAWEDAQRRQQAGDASNHGQPSFDEPRRNESRQANRPAIVQPEYYSAARDERHPGELQYEARYAGDVQQNYGDIPITRPADLRYRHPQVMVRPSMLDQYRSTAAGFELEKVKRLPVVEASQPWTLEPRGQEQRPIATNTPPSPHDVLPSIETIDLSCDSPAMRGSRRIMDAPQHTHEEQVVYRRYEPEPRLFRPLPAHSEVIYIDDTDRLPKRRRVMEPARFEPSQPEVEYVRVRQVQQRQDAHLFPSSPTAPRGLDSRYRNEPLPQCVLVGGPTSLSHRLPPREVRLIRPLSAHDTAVGELSLHDPCSQPTAPRGESQAPKRQRTLERGHTQDAMFRAVDGLSGTSMAHVRMHQQPLPHGAMSAQQRPVFGEPSQRPPPPRPSQPEYQSHMNAFPAGRPLPGDVLAAPPPYRRVPHELDFTQENRLRHGIPRLRESVSPPPRSRCAGRPGERDVLLRELATDAPALYAGARHVIVLD